MTDERLAEIDAMLAAVREWNAMSRCKFTGSIVAELLAEVRRLREEIEACSEFGH